MQQNMCLPSFPAFSPEKEEISILRNVFFFLGFKIFKALKSSKNSKLRSIGNHTNHYTTEATAPKINA
jgi:hypothetical protein